MKINLKQLFSIVGESKDIAYTIQKGELSEIHGYDFTAVVEPDGSQHADIPV